MLKIVDCLCGHISGRTGYARLTHARAQSLHAILWMLWLECMVARIFLKIDSLSTAQSPGKWNGSFALHPSCSCEPFLSSLWVHAMLDCERICWTFCLSHLAKFCSFWRQNVFPSCKSAFSAKIHILEERFREVRIRLIILIFSISTSNGRFFLFEIHSDWNKVWVGWYTQIQRSTHMIDYGISKWAATV
jgi:hypothetical protein